MAFNKISSEVIELVLDNYVTSTVKAGSSVSDLGYRVYADTAGVSPVDGTGGSPGVTLSVNTSSPLSGTADLRLVKDDVNRQGNGFSVDFSVANRHLAKVLQVTFDAELISGNYESPIVTPTTGTYSITSTTVCTVTAPHSFVAGQAVTMSFTSGTRPPDGTYVISSVTATTFVFTVASGSGTGNCSYTVPADLRISIIQDPTGTPVVIEPVNTNIQLGVVNQRIRHIATFQTHISITSYRLCIHISNASTLAFVVDFNNFRVWEPFQSIGSVITDWQSYTPTLIGFGTTTSQDFQWRRVGGNMEIQGKWTAGTVQGVEIRIPLPFGTIDSIRVPSIRAVGNIGTNTNANQIGATVYGWQPLAEPSVSYLTMGGQYNTQGTFSKLSGTNLITGTIYSLQASVPIAGWGSSVAMSSDSGDGRVVAANYSNLVSATADANTPIRFATLVNDTHNAYNTSTGKFTAPLSGYYSISVAYSHGTTNNSKVYIDGVSAGSIRIILSTSSEGTGSTVVFLNAGQTVEIRPDSSGTVVAGQTDRRLSIYRIAAGSQVIGSVEGVACHYTSTNGQNINATGDIIFYENRKYDTHGAYNSSTGVFTAPVTGKYLIHATGATASGSFVIAVKKNDASTTFLTGVITVTGWGSNVPGTTSALVHLNAGEFISIGAYNVSTASLRTDEYYNNLFVTRVGI